MFGRRLIGHGFRQLQREADFRFSLVRVREHADHAFHDGEAREMSTLQRLFAALYANYQQVLRWQFRLNLFRVPGHNFLIILLPTVIIAGDVLSGQLEVGRAVQAAGAFAAILTR